MDHTHTDQKSLIFTDLDGTLLDHETYGFEKASRALKKIAAMQIPLILNSSKTMAEIIEIRRSLENTHPFIAENGSIVAVPEHYFPFEAKVAYSQLNHPEGFLIRRMGGDRGEILDILKHLRREHRFSFSGFNDLSVQALSQLTGLPKAETVLAKQRLSTEPVLWEDSTKNLKKFMSLLAKNGLQALQGGRFLSISRPFDKQDGVLALLALYQKKTNETLFKIGLGDSPNDQKMLEIMDLAVIIQSKKSNQIQLNHPGQIIRTERSGPGGWQEAMDKILGR
jgi:mannosyl-3-phosphoglycerate phosphatase